jgi:hypothetical protein
MASIFDEQQATPRKDHANMQASRRVTSSRARKERFFATLCEWLLE